jgi:hypothetical protein
MTSTLESDRFVWQAYVMKSDSMQVQLSWVVLALLSIVGHIPLALKLIIWLSFLLSVLF